MNEMTQAVNRLFQHLSACNNRELLYDLYPYVWDIRGVISLLNSYTKWLGESLKHFRDTHIFDASRENKTCCFRSCCLIFRCVDLADAEKSFCRLIIFCGSLMIHLYVLISLKGVIFVTEGACDLKSVTFIAKVQKLSSKEYCKNTSANKCYTFLIVS